MGVEKKERFFNKIDPVQTVHNLASYEQGYEQGVFITLAAEMGQFMMLGARYGG